MNKTTANATFKLAASIVVENRNIIFKFMYHLIYYFIVILHYS
jgi:hypothetical protein